MYFRSGGRNEKDRYAYNYLTVEQFLKIKVYGKNLSDFFEKNNFKNIAICGVDSLGQLLSEELKETSVNVKYFVDDSFIKMPFGMDGIKVISANDIRTDKDIDVFVIASLFEGNDIIDRLLQNKVNIDKIISLSDVVYGLE